jgi:plastocyanin
MVRFAITVLTGALAGLAGLVSTAHGGPGGASGASAPGGTRGVIRGTVTFEGEPPERLPVRRDTDPLCAKIEKFSEDVVVTDGKLKDVLVRIKNGTLTGKRPGAARSPAEPAPVVIDQKDCAYAPHVVGIVAGQKLAIRNSDATFHNVHGAIGGTLLWNRPASPGDPEIVVDGSARPGDVIDVICDVHPWMHAYAVVQDHPAFAVTGADGVFELTGLAPGSYTVEAWHPVLGTRSATITLGKAGASARFTFKREP